MLLQAVALKLDRHNMPAIRRVCALLRTLTVPEAGQRRENRLTPERLKQLVVGRFGLLERQVSERRTYWTRGLSPGSRPSL